MAETEKELLIRFEGKLDLFNERVNMLSDSIEKFSDTLRYLEDKKIADLQRQVEELRRWKERLSGAWAAIIVVTSVITYLVGLAIKGV